LALKILQTPARFYPYTGGVENYTYHLSRELIRLGHEVKIICANEPKDGKSINNGIKLKRLDYIGKIANTNITLTLPFHILKEDFDLIHTHLPTPWSADWSAIFSIGKRKPLVLSYHNDIVGDGSACHIAKGYNLTALKYLKKYQEKIEIIPVGVDIGRFTPSETETEYTIFFLSLLDEFHKYKGLDYLLGAIELVKKEIPVVKLIVGGSGKLLNYYREKTASMGLENNVDFAGYISNESIPDYYRNCNLFVLPSISASQEGFGIVLLEAMASGRPVIGSDIVGVAEDIDKYSTGIVVKPRDTKALADAIIRILQDKKEAKRMGINGRELIEEKYSWVNIAKKIETIYNSIEV
jgi:glycosyltransferase involved in cell wall biosynthesis